MMAGADLPALLAELRDLLGHRRIEEGVRKLDGIRPFLDMLGPATKNAGTLLGLVAQWVDAGFEDRAPHPPVARAVPLERPIVSPSHRLPAPSHGRGRGRHVAGGVQQASAHFRLVDSLGGETGDNELLSIASFGPAAACGAWAVTTTP